MTHEDPMVKDLLSKVELGLDTTKFLETKLGRHMVETLLSDHQQAFDSFLTVDPADTKAVQAAQNKANMSIWLLEYFDTVMQSGINAEEQINQLEKE